MELTLGHWYRLTSRRSAAVVLAAAVLANAGLLSGCGISGTSAERAVVSRSATALASPIPLSASHAGVTSTGASSGTPPVTLMPSARAVLASGPVLGAAGGGVFAAVTGDSLNLDRARDGRVLRRLGTAHAGRTRIVTIGVVKPGELAITWSTAPRCSNDHVGCGPVPHSCGARVETLQLATGRTAALLRTGPDTQIYSSVLSPDGTQLAAVVTSCTTVTPVTHVVVKRLRDGKTWTMGTGDNYCQYPDTPAWSADGTHLLVPFTSGTPALAAGKPTDACTDPQVSALVSVPAHHSQPGLSGTRLPAAAGCFFGSIAGAGRRLYAVQSCPLHQTRTDAASLVRLSPTGKPLRWWRLGPCSFAAPAVSADGRVLIAGGQDCRGTRQLGAATPGTFLDRLDGTTLTRVVTRTGFTTGFDLVAW